MGRESSCKVGEVRQVSLRHRARDGRLEISESLTVHEAERECVRGGSRPHLLEQPENPDGGRTSLPGIPLMHG